VLCEINPYFWQVNFGAHEGEEPRRDGDSSLDMQGDDDEKTETHHALKGHGTGVVAVKRQLVNDVRAWFSNTSCTLFRRASCQEDIDALEEFKKLPSVSASTTATVVADHLELILPVFPRLLVWDDEDDDEKNATEEGLVQQMVALHDKP